MDDKQKQELNEVLKAHHRSKGDVAKSYLKKVRTGAILGVGLDLLFTGGFGTVVAVSAATLPALKAAFRSAAKRGVLIRDDRQQKIKASADVMIVLAEIEVGLSNAFNEATKPFTEKTRESELDVLLLKKNLFLKDAERLSEEARKLAPAIRIVDGGPQNYGTDALTVNIRAWSQRGDFRSKTEIITLDEARAEITQDIAAIEKLRAARAEAHREAERKAREVKRPKGFNI